MAETYIEAAFNGPDGSQDGHFFLGDHFVTYDWATDRARNGARTASEWGIPAIFTPPPTATTAAEPAGLDAAVNGRAGFNAFAYAFKGTSYARLRLAPRGLDGTGALSVWALPGAAFAGGVDAGFNGRLSRDGKGYLFRGGEYNRYDWNADRADTTDPSGNRYPRPISNMVGMPAEFASGISAAIDGAGRFTDVGYLFRQRSISAIPVGRGGSGRAARRRGGQADSQDMAGTRRAAARRERRKRKRSSGSPRLRPASRRAASGSASATGGLPRSRPTSNQPYPGSCGQGTSPRQIQATYAAVMVTLGNSANELPISDRRRSHDHR